jgi:hypothetical protein
MNVLKIEPPATPDARAAAGLWELGAGALLAYTVEVPVGGDPGALPALRQALEAEREGLDALLPALAPEEIAHLLADLLNRSLAGAPAAFALALAKDSVLHLLAGGGGAAYLGPTPADGPVRRVTDGTVSFLLPGAAAAATASGPASRRLQAAAAALADIVRLPIAKETRLVLVSGEMEPTLEERLLAALRTAQEPGALEALLRGPIERTGGALLAWTATAPSGEAPVETRAGIETELATLRRELERRLARLDGRLKEVEDFALDRVASPGRSRLLLPGLPSLTRPRLPLVRRPLPGSPEDLASADDAPAFERGLDVPVASNWSRPLLLVTGGVTLILFLSIQLFCPAVPRRRVIPAAPRAVPAAAAAPAAGAKGTPAANPKPPVGVLLVTPSSEPEGTEGAATEPPPRR